MIPVTDINYKPNIDQLLLEVDHMHDSFMEYRDDRHGIVKGWLILRESVDTPVLKTEREKFNIKYSLTGKSRARYYIQNKGVYIPPHIDYNTKCSANFILTGSPDPICFEDGEYAYRNAIINTTKKHWVNSTNKRILFKISYFDIDYEKMLSNINESI